MNIKNAGKTIDLHSEITKITNKLVTENTGKSPVCNFIFALDPRQNNYLNCTSVLLREHGGPELKVKKLGDLELKNTHYHNLFYQIELKDLLQPERSISVEVEVISAHELTPHTKKILQKEKQLAKYSETLYLFLHYSVTKQTIIVLLP